MHENLLKWLFYSLQCALGDQSLITVTREEVMPFLNFLDCNSTYGILACASEMGIKIDVDFGACAVNIYTMLAASGPQKVPVLGQEGSSLTFLWVWTMSHLWNYRLIPMAGGLKTQKSLFRQVKMDLASRLMLLKLLLNSHYVSVWWAWQLGQMWRATRPQFLYHFYYVCLLVGQ